MELVELELEKVANGGSIVARHQGKVVFVTGGLPGERAVASITETGKRFDRAEVTEVLRESPGRVEPPCPIAQTCGGCDWQHASEALQLELKTQVVAEQLRRLAGIEWTGKVESVGPAAASRTRMRYSVDGSGRVGLKKRRSHDIVPLPEQGCMVAAGGIDVPELQELGTGASQLEVVEADGSVNVLVDGEVRKGLGTVTHRVGGHTFEVSTDGFWQGHPKAPQLLSEAVLAALQPQAGEKALDLYCGVGLFAGGLAQAGCSVLGVESNRRAIRHARRNVPEAKFMARDVSSALKNHRGHVDLVVLDPPRKGAGATVVRRLAALAPRTIAYVSCDAATLARDLATFAELGFEAQQIHAWDLFPMTAHVECLAVLSRAAV